MDIVLPNGKRLRESTGTKDRRAAQQFHDKLKADVWRQHRLGERPVRLWEEAVIRFVHETNAKKSHEDDKRMLRELAPAFRDRPLQDLSWDFISETVETLKARASASTKNRHYALIRSILRRAERYWNWIDRAPVIRLHREPPGRVRFLSPEEMQRLLDELPSHQSDVVVFAVATGLRAGNIRRLRWSNVDLKAKALRFPAGEMKSGQAHGVPLNRVALEILERQRGVHPTHVFTFRGHPIANLNTRAFREVLARAGIGDFRFHDLRHCFASFLVQSGVPMNIVRELGGWQTEAMVRRYAHLSPHHLAPHAERLDEFFQSQTKLQPEETTAQIRHNRQIPE